MLQCGGSGHRLDTPRGCSMGNRQLGQSAQSTRVSNSLWRLAGHRLADHPLAVVDGCLY